MGRGKEKQIIHSEGAAAGGSLFSTNSKQPSFLISKGDVMNRGRGIACYAPTGRLETELHSLIFRGKIN
jgi:hypothetical protein